MRIICELLEDNEQTYNIIDTIKNAIPCFVAILVLSNCIQCSFEVRQEDVAFVEKMLAPLVQ